VTVYELSGTANMGNAAEPPCPHANAQQGYPDVGVLFCPDCGWCIDKQGNLLFFNGEPSGAD